MHIYDEISKHNHKHNHTIIQIHTGQPVTNYTKANNYKLNKIDIIYYAVTAIIKHKTQ
jgi:hypothetical protein